MFAEEEEEYAKKIKVENTPAINRPIDRQKKKGNYLMQDAHLAGEAINIFYGKSVPLQGYFYKKCTSSL